MSGSAETRVRGRRLPPPIHEGTDDRPLIDKHGRRYRAEVLERWPAAVIRVLGIRHLDDGGGA